MESLGFPAPNSTDWSFRIFSQASYSQAVNDSAVNFLPPQYDPLALQKNYIFLMQRSSSVSYLGREFNENSLKTYLPPQTSIASGDYLLCIRITPSTVGVYWVTTSASYEYPATFPVGHIDPLVITCDMPASRGAGINGAPYYATRGVRLSDYNTVNASINDVAINADSGVPVNYTSDPYLDKYNAVSTIVDRSKVSFIHAVESI
jgi:hypothetical protein